MPLFHLMYYLISTYFLLKFLPNYDLFSKNVLPIFNLFLTYCFYLFVLVKILNFVRARRFFFAFSCLYYIFDFFWGCELDRSFVVLSFLYCRHWKSNETIYFVGYICLHWGWVGRLCVKNNLLPLEFFSQSRWFI